MITRNICKSCHLCYRAILIRLTTGVKEALDILQAVTVDAICSDFNMKDGTGLDLLEKIRHKGLRTPFLLMSGDDSRTLEQKAKLYYGGFCCKTDFDLIRKIKALVSN